MVAGVLFVLGDLLGLSVDPDDVAELIGAATTVPFAVQHLLYLLGAVLLTAAVVSLYVHQAKTAGSLGLVSFLVAFLGTALSIGIFWAQAHVTPNLARLVPGILEFLDLGQPWGSRPVLVLFTLGWSLFGLATLRAGVYPRVASVLLVVGAVLIGMTAIFRPFASVRAILFGLRVTWLGSVLFLRSNKDV